MIEEKITGRLVEELKKDKDPGSYYHAWQSNIAMSFYDECARNGVDGPLIHKVANQAAKNFLDLLIKG